MYFVYVLQSEVDGRLYKGMTNNLKKRIAQHNFGKNRSTKGFLPWCLVHQEVFDTAKSARAREKYFNPHYSRIFYYKAKLPVVIENAQFFFPQNWATILSVEILCAFQFYGYFDFS